MSSVWLVFCDCGFHSACPLMEKDKRLMEASWWERLIGAGDWVLMGGAKLSKSLIQFSIDGWTCVPCLLFGLRPNCQSMPLPETPGHSQASLAQSLVESLLLSPGSWCTQDFFVPSKSLFLQSCGSSVIKSYWLPRLNSLGVLSPFTRSPGWEICCGS